MLLFHAGLAQGCHETPVDVARHRSETAKQPFRMPCRADLSEEPLRLPQPSLEADARRRPVEIRRM